jgi:hypothetical protein
VRSSFKQDIAYADAHFAGWTSWWWFPEGCLALISDWSGSPTPLGNVIKGALLGYDDPPASPPRPLGPGLNFTFNHALQGWEFNLFDNSVSQNLAVHPDPASLQVRVGFTSSSSTWTRTSTLAIRG